MRTSTLGMGSARRRAPGGVGAAFLALARWMASSIRVARVALSCGFSMRMVPLAAREGAGAAVCAVAVRAVAPQAARATSSCSSSGRGRRVGAGIVFFMGFLIYRRRTHLL